jgi:hypothetical protein
MCWIRWCDLANDQEIVQHPHRSEFLLNGRFGPRKVLNPGSHMERAHSLEFQAVHAAPFKKLPARPGVGSPSVPVADRGGEEVNVGFSDFKAGSGNQLRDPRT